MGTDLLTYRQKLLREREELLSDFEDFETAWQQLGEREIELEEEAQKTDLTSLFDRLEQRENQEIEEIDLALAKMALGGYGLCEHCGKPIAEGRLAALPAARLCHRCAERFEKRGEKLPRAREVITKAELPPEYRDLSDEEVCEAVTEYLRDDGQVNLEELELQCRRGVLYLEGVIPSEAEHQVLQRLVTEVLGLRAVIDHLRITDLPWEREDRTPGREQPATRFEEGAVTETEEPSEDLFASQEEDLAYTAPDRPPPEQE